MALHPGDTLSSGQYRIARPPGAAAQLCRWAAFPIEICHKEMKR
jgi:hypothetical protein